LIIFANRTFCLNDLKANFNIKGSFGNFNTDELVKQHKSIGSQFPNAADAIKNELRDRSRFGDDDKAFEYLATIREKDVT
jgi:hypothetical protein